jgi:segregation and condensation protein B
MEPNKTAAAIETILFAMGDSVEVSALALALEISQNEVREAVKALEERYDAQQSGLMINWFEDAVQLSSRPEYYEYLVKIAKAPKKQVLTDTLMETLSIIAFKQPVTRAEVESIRGVNSDFAISKLVGFDLVCEVGRKDAPGRPLLFGTTEQFLRSFGLSSLADLPNADTDQVEEMREQAEQEVDGRLEI